MKVEKFEKIRSKADLKAFIDADMRVRDLKRLPFLYQVRKPLVYFTIMLRKAEYYENTKNGFLTSLMANYMKLRVKRLGMHMGLSVPLNTFGSGLFLVHWGSIVVSANANIGNNCRIHSDVNIGAHKGGAPRIGNNVYIGPGAKIFGNINIGDNAVIGANAVVNKSFPGGVTILGVPAKVIHNKVYELRIDDNL